VIEVDVDWNKVIEYKSYPRSLAFYSIKHNKIYVNPILFKYPVAHNYHLEHEKRHYTIYNKYKNLLILFTLNLMHEWHSVFTQLRLIRESTSCYNEYRKIHFSKEEIVKFDSEFLPKFPSQEWVIQILYECLRPDDYGIILLCTILTYPLLGNSANTFYFLFNLFGFIVLRIVKKFNKI